MDTMLLAVLDAAETLGVNLAIGVVACWMLPVRNRLLFLSLMVVPLPLLSRLIDTTAVGPLNIVGYFASYLLLPVLFWKGGLVRRLTAGAILLVMEFVIELACSLAFLYLDIPLARSFISLEAVLARAVAIALYLVLGRLLSRVPTSLPIRSEGEGAGESLPGADAAPETAHLVFMAPQLAVAIASSLLLLVHRSISPVPYMLMTGVLTCCIVIYVIAESSFRRYRDARAAASRARSLSDQLSVHVRGSRLHREASEQAARFRHDMRNHLQVLSSLIASGDLKRSISYITDLRGRLIPRDELDAGRGDR